MTLVRRPLMLLAPAAILVVALALATNVLPLRQIVDQRREIAETTARLEAMMAENAMLDSQVAALETPVEVERLAREQLGYVRPGEEAYVVMDPTPGEAAETVIGTAAGESAVESTGSQEAGLLDKIWNYMTGRDLAPGE